MRLKKKLRDLEQASDMPEVTQLVGTGAGAEAWVHTVPRPDSSPQLWCEPWEVDLQQGQNSPGRQEEVMVTRQAPASSSSQRGGDGVGNLPLQGAWLGVGSGGRRAQGRQAQGRQRAQLVVRPPLQEKAGKESRAEQSVSWCFWFMGD